MAFKVKNLSALDITVMGVSLNKGDSLDLSAHKTSAEIVTSLMGGELYDKIQGRMLTILTPSVDVPTLNLTDTQFNFLAHAGFFQGLQGEDDLKTPTGSTSSSIVTSSSSSGGLGTGASVDAFTRLRTSSPVTIFDDHSKYGNNTLVWETLANNGTLTNDTDSASIILSNNGTTDGNSIVRQTKAHFRYQPGKSQFIALTFSGNDFTDNVVKTIGYADGYNGIFFKINGSSLSLVKRSNSSGSVVETEVSQSNWNLDPLDGSGGSAITLNALKTQILIIDLQWLGVGRVRVGFDIDGKLYYVHEFIHANLLDKTYMGMGSLPLRSEIYNDGTAGGTSTFTCICGAVISEGGIESARGPQYSTNTGSSLIAVTTRVPLLSMRAKSTGPNSAINTGEIIPLDINLLATSQPIFYEIILNGTLTGASWSDFNSSLSLSQIDTSATGISGGVVIDSGYIAAGGNASSKGGTAGGSSISQYLVLVYAQLNQTQDVLTVVATRASASGTSDVGASITWQEQG